MTSLSNNDLGFSDTEMDEFFTYLDDLRESGETNMFGARPYLQAEFSLDKDKAGKVLVRWMETFEERHAPKGVVRDPSD